MTVQAPADLDPAKLCLPAAWLGPWEAGGWVAGPLSLLPWSSPYHNA